MSLHRGETIDAKTLDSRRRNSREDNTSLTNSASQHPQLGKGQEKLSLKKFTEQFKSAGITEPLDSLFINDLVKEFVQTHGGSNKKSLGMSAEMLVQILTEDQNFKNSLD